MTDTAAPSVTSLVSRTRALSDDRDLLTALGPDGFVWLRDGAGLVTAGVAARIPVPAGPGRIAAAAEDTAELLAALDNHDPLALPGTGPIAVGALPFGEAAAAELVVPAVVVGRTENGQGWITETGPEHELEPRRELAAATPIIDGGGRETALVVVGVDGRPRWTRAVNRALELIAAGTITKVVLSRQLEIRAGRPFDTRAVVDRLRRRHVSCWTYAMGTFVGASPELLVRRRGDHVESRPMAGTVAQGITPAEDNRLVALLESSAKERAEHALVVDEVLAGLAPVCAEVDAHPGPEVVRLASVAHLATTVVGRLHEPPPSALALAGRLHPTPAVAGAPRAAALAAIAEMENFDRGLYAGPVGWVDRRGDGDWAVALRGADLRGDRAVLTAGAGIVADSDADAEWRETRAKLESMLKVLAGV